MCEVKVVYGLKLFKLAEDEKPFFTQWYGNSKGVIVGTKIIMQKMITALLALENTATMEMRSGYSVLP